MGEKKQRQFDKALNDERMISLKISEERDQAMGEAREKETRAISLNHECDELKDRIDELDRKCKSQQVELEELVGQQDATGRSVHEHERMKRNLESKIEELKTQLEEVEDELQITEDAKLRTEVNMQAAKANHERDMQAKKKEYEEKRRNVLKQMRTIEQELEEERK